MKMVRFTFSALFAVALSSSFFATPAVAQNPNQGANIAAGILQGIANGLSPNQPQFPQSNPFYPPNNNVFYPPSSNPFPKPNPPVFIQQQTPQWVFNPATGQWMQQQTTNVMQQSAFDPLRNTMIPGSESQSSSMHQLPDGRWVTTHDHSWIGLDGRPHGNTTTTTMSNGPGGIQQQNTVYSARNQQTTNRPVVRNQYAPVRGSGNRNVIRSQGSGQRGSNSFRLK